MGKGSGPVIGFRYSMGLHMGLCVGPVDALLQINGGDDKVAYSTPITSSTAFTINLPELYGGDKKEGGIVGSGWVMMGEATQMPNPYLLAELGTPMPAFRGLCTVVFNGEVGALSPYIKAWAFKVRKTKAGWRTPVWQPDLCEIDVGSGIKAMNAAHLLYRCITDPVTGLGKPESALDLDRMLVAAQTLFNEGLGLCLRWSRSQVLGNFLATICTHVGGIWAEDPSTGKQYLKLLRGDYDIDTCVAVDETNIIELQSYQPQTITGSVNEVTVTWHSPITNKDASVTVHNLANIQAQGHTINQANTYPGIPTADLATRTAERDVRATSSLPVKVKLVVKSSVVVAKGDVLAFSWADLKVVKMPIRVMEIDRGGPTDSSITLDCVQDVYALPTASYIVAQPGLWVPPNTTPAPLAYQRLIEATWRDISMRMSAGDLAQVDASSAYIGALGVEPSGVVAYDYTMKSRVSGAPDYLEVAAGTFAPTGTLVAAMACEAGPTDVSLADPQRLEEVEIGDEVLVDDELMRVTAIDPVAATATLARGCVDTAPADHAIGARVWFTDRHTGADPTEYLDGETVQAKLLMRTSSGTLDESLATALSATLEARQALPYPPAGLTVNGSAYPASVIEPLSLAWVARNRLTQADQLVDTTAGTIAAEVGTTYTVRVYLNDVLDSTTTGITALTASPAVSGYGQLRVEIDAVRDGLASYQPLTASFDYSGESEQVLVGDGVLHPSAAFSRLSSGTYFDATPIMQTAAANEPRWDHDPLAGAPLGLLIEQQSTNVRTWSRYNSLWTLSNVTQSVGSVAAPDGSMATKITIPTGDGSAKRRVVDPASQLPDGLMTAQWWMKPDSTTFHYAELFNYAGPNPGAARLNVVVDLSDGSVVVIDPIGHPAGQSYALANAWLRYALTYTNGTPADNAYCEFCPASGEIINHAWVGDDSFQYLFASQVEAGGVATSYIPTNGAAATRAADILTFPDPGTTGTLVITHDVPAGGNLFTATGYTLASTATGKTAIAWDASGSMTVVNGGAGTTGAAISWGSAVQVLTNANGHVSNCRLYSTKLTEAQMQALTA